MTDKEKEKILEDLFSLEDVTFSKEEFTGGYCQVQPNGNHQAVLLFGWSDKKNSLSSKVPLSDESEALDVYEAITYAVAQKNIKARPRLGAFTLKMNKEESPFGKAPKQPKGDFFANS
jgi:hypothetical protein